jgi:hypothetical protein
MIVRRKALLYATITLFLPLFVGFAIGQVWSSFSLRIGAIIIEVTLEDIVERVQVFPEHVANQLEEIPVFNQCMRTFLGILTNNALLLSFIVLLPLLEIVEEYALNKSNWYRKICNNVSDSLPNFPQPYAAISIIFGSLQGIVAGFLLSFFPISTIFNLPIVPASIEFFVFILAIAFLYELHFRKKLTTETIIPLYKTSKNYFTTIFLLLIVAALIESSLLMS